MPCSPWIRRAIVASALAAVLVACDTGASDVPEMSQEARSYLDAVVDVMEANALVRKAIDWQAFRRQVYEVAAGAQRIQDTYRAIERALTLLQDGHSSFRTVEGPLLFASMPPCGSPIVDDVSVPADVGYVRIRPFSGGGSDADAYLRSIHQGIAAFDGEDLAGWIVDLRGNLGGDLWLMLAGAGPVLGEGEAGRFVDADGGIQVWEYRDGASWLDGAEMRRVPEPYTLIRPNPRVAVLTDNRTIIQGEGVAIAFRGRSDTRTFGQATCGVTTHTQPFTMRDGGILDLVVAAMADRTGATYPAGLHPDQVVLGVVPPIDEAVEWLRSGTE
jgi:carboxyl-terminal processing protease